jgi:DNA-binding NtrC family response regulator
MKKTETRQECEHAIDIAALNVLVVDDEEMITNMIEKSIALWGHSVVSVSGVKEARKKLAEIEFDLCFVDINVSNGNGLALVRDIRKLLPEGNIVAMTGDSSRETELRIRELRVMYFLIKPVERAELQSIIDHVSKRKTLDQVKDQVPHTAVPARGCKSCPEKNASTTAIEKP